MAVTAQDRYNDCLNRYGDEEFCASLLGQDPPNGGNGSNNESNDMPEMETHGITWVSKETGNVAGQQAIEEAVFSNDFTGIIPTVVTEDGMVPVKFTPFPGQDAVQAPEGHVTAYLPDGRTFAIPLEWEGVSDFVGNTANIEANEQYFQETGVTSFNPNTFLWVGLAVVIGIWAWNQR